MRFHTFLLKYGEIGIKGKNRHLFEDALVRQVRYALKDVDGQFDVHKSQARIYVDCEGDYDYDETVIPAAKSGCKRGRCDSVCAPPAACPAF